MKTFKMKLQAFIHKVKSKDFDFTLTKRDRILMVGIIVSFLFFDLVTKSLVQHKLIEGNNYEIIDNFFYLTYVRNEGMAWSLLWGARWLFVIGTLFAIGVLVYFFVITKKNEVLTRYGITFVLGGTLGNLFDRVVFGYVRDFLNFYVFGYDFPIFNIADIGVVLGFGLIILEIIIQEYQLWKLSKSL